jgi:hypothetical protein
MPQLKTPSTSKSASERTDNDSALVNHTHTSTIEDDVPICSECSEDLQGEELKGRYYGMCRQCATGEEPEL